MDTLSAFAMGQANKGQPKKVFDWHKAAELIKERKPELVSAGLCGDWDWTGGDIWKNGEPIPEDETYVYLASNWATPEIEIDGEKLDCFVMEGETDGWDSSTYWPESSVEILKAQ